MYGKVYKLTNKINNKMYIGMTTDIMKRMSAHKMDRRFISAISRSIDKYGFQNFKLEILEECENRIKLIEKEKYYIKKYNTYKGKHYNMTSGGDGGVVGKENPLYGIKRTEEVKKKISETKKNNYHPTRGKKLPKWWIDKSRVPRGEKNARAKEYIVISPEGNKKKIKSLTNFCRENNLQQANMWKVAKGRRTHHKGWKCMEVVPNEQ